MTQIKWTLKVLLRSEDGIKISRQKQIMIDDMTVGELSDKLSQLLKWVTPTVKKSAKK